MLVTSTTDGFSMLDTSHQVAMAVLVAGALLLVRVGRARRGTDRVALAGRLLAAAILLVGVPLQILFLTAEYRSLERTLPLQLCDLAWMAAAYALWTHRWWAVALTYYWGLTLTTQAILTPDLAAGFPDPAFFVFWTLHSMVVWAAVYLTWGLGLTPGWRSYRTAIAATAAWAVSVFLFNVVAGTNYGYLNAKPSSASILDLLGDWPWYVLAEVVIVTVAWALLTWPWTLRGRARPSAPARYGSEPRRGNDGALPGG